MPPDAHAGLAGASSTAPRMPEEASIETMRVFAQVLEAPMIFLAHLLLASPRPPGCREPDMSVADVLLVSKRVA